MERKVWHLGSKLQWRADGSALVANYNEPLTAPNGGWQPLRLGPYLAMIQTAVIPGIGYRLEIFRAGNLFHMSEWDSFEQAKLNATLAIEQSEYLFQFGPYAKVEPTSPRGDEPAPLRGSPKEVAFTGIDIVEPRPEGWEPPAITTDEPVFIEHVGADGVERQKIK